MVLVFAYGFIIFVTGFAGYFILSESERPVWATFSAWACGVGAGIFISAIWAVRIFNDIIGG